MNITVLGAGAWGTAMAVAAAKQTLPDGQPAHRVRLWTRQAEHAQAMQQARVNARYLPMAPLPDALMLSAAPLSEASAWLAGEDMVVLATPMSALRSMLTHWQALSVPVVWLCEGFEKPTPYAQGVGLLGHEIAAQVAPHAVFGVLSGPSFAKEVALGQPTALVAASGSPALRQAMVQAFHSNGLRVYASDDVVGVEVGGAVKNVMAIATGLCDGLQLGLNARAALITRGLAEITRLGVALGAKTETLMGLSGLGDLVLTATGDLSRNRQVGLLLAQGMHLDAAVASLGHVAEGVYSARTVVLRAQHLGVSMPISQAVVDLLDGRLAPAQAVQVLMGRSPTCER